MSTFIKWKAPCSLNYNLVSSFMVLFVFKSIIVNLYGQMTGFRITMKTHLWVCLKKGLMDERRLMTIIRMGRSSNLNEPNLETPEQTCPEVYHLAHSRSCQVDE